MLSVRRAIAYRLTRGCTNSRYLSNISHPPELFWSRGKQLDTFSSLQDDISTDVCVIGLGGSGLSCITELLKLGKRVVGLDAGCIGGAAAGKNGGFLLAGTASFYHEAIQHFGAECARNLYQMTVDEITTMYDQTPEAIRQTGSLRLADSENELPDCLAHFEALKNDNFPCSWYSGSFGDGILISTDCSFNPLQRCRTLATLAVQQGAKLFECSQVLPTFTGTKVTTQSSSGDFGASVHCENVIVAVDGNLELLVPELQLGNRVRSARFQMIATEPCGPQPYPCPVYGRWGYDYYQQLEDGVVVFGGGRDQDSEGEWSNSPDCTAPIQSYLAETLRSKLQVTAEITHSWAANVAFNDTGLPLFEEIRPGVWVVGAYCGTGNVMGSLAGRAVAHKALGHESKFYDVIHSSNSQPS